MRALAKMGVLRNVFLGGRIHLCVSGCGGKWGIRLNVVFLLPQEWIRMCPLDDPIRCRATGYEKENLDIAIIEIAQRSAKESTIPRTSPRAVQDCQAPWRIFKFAVSNRDGIRRASLGNERQRAPLGAKA